MNPDAEANGVVAAVKRAVRELPAEALPALIAELEGAKALAWARLVTPPPSTRAADQATANMTAEQLASVFNVPRSFFYELARQGRVPCLRLGRYVRFNRAEVERTLTEVRNSKTTTLGTPQKRRSDRGLQGAATALLPGRAE